jgi:hypothetical protein
VVLHNVLESVYLLRAAIFDDSACFSSVTLCLSNLFAGDDVIILGLEAGVGSYTFLFTGRLISRLHTLYLPTRLEFLV